jgi:hypothetical protein
VNDNTSKVRFQDPNGKDIIVVEIATGKVEISDPARLDEAAMLFWHAIERTWGQAQDVKVFRDMVLKAGQPGDYKAGDIRILPGDGWRAHEANGGDVTVFIEAVRKRADAGTAEG